MSEQVLPPIKLAYNNFIGKRVKWHNPGPNSTDEGEVLSVRHCPHLQKDVASVRIDPQMVEIVDCDRLVPVQMYYAIFSELHFATDPDKYSVVELTDGTAVVITCVDALPNCPGYVWPDKVVLGQFKFYLYISEGSVESLKSSRSELPKMTGLFVNFKL